MFQKKSYPVSLSDAEPAPLSGTLNGKPFSFFEDADSRLGAKLEVFAAGNYVWLPMEHVASIEMEAPKRLRDLLWIPALVRTGPGFKERELGEVLFPVLTPLAYTHGDDAIRLGRVTVWEEVDGEAQPAGQRCFLVDEEEVPILEIRKLEFQMPETAANDHAAAE
jgi:type VI secretion system protein ImpE